MADAAKPALTLAQIAANAADIRRMGSAADELIAKEAELYRRLLSFAFSDDVPPAVSLAAQRDALDRVNALKAIREMNGDTRDATPEEAAEAEALAEKIHVLKQQRAKR
jgi:hypothetical protein